MIAVPFELCNPSNNRWNAETELTHGVPVVSTKLLIRWTSDHSRLCFLSESMADNPDTQFATPGTSDISQPLPRASRAIVWFYTHPSVLQNAFDTVF